MAEQPPETGIAWGGRRKQELNKQVCNKKRGYDAKEKTGRASREQRAGDRAAWPKEPDHMH